MNRIYYAFPGGKSKCLTMSYDDGKIQDKRLIEIFDKFGIKGTFNLNSGLFEADDSFVKPDEICDVYKNHEVATHTFTHPTLERCPLSEVAFEILEDRKKLEEILKKPVRGNAYPNGSYTQEIEELFKKLGISYARVVGAVPAFDMPKNRYEWHPTAHHNSPELMQLAEFFSDFKKKQYLKLMYVWGHSYEFDRDNNWKVIEEFCNYMGGHDDIWYATNIEIIDYMDAAKRLVFSADNSFVYNPNVMDICLDVNGEYINVKGGTTVFF